MKVKIGLIFGLIFSANAITAEVAICEKTGLPKIANESVTDIMKPMKTLSDDELETVIKKICGNIILSRTNGFKPNEFKEIILDELDVSPTTDSEAKNELVSNFLNQNKQKLICPKATGKTDSRDLHIFKTAALEGTIDLYDEILLDDEEYEIDLNAYEIVNGKKETIVDYLDKLLAGQFKGDEDLELLRDDIIDMGGKRGVEL